MGEGLKADESRDGCIPPHRCWDMGRKIVLPHHQPSDNTRRQKGNCPNHMG